MFDTYELIMGNRRTFFTCGAGQVEIKNTIPSHVDREYPIMRSAARPKSLAHNSGSHNGYRGSHSRATEKLFDSKNNSVNEWHRWLARLHQHIIDSNSIRVANARQQVILRGYIRQFKSMFE